MYEKEIVVQGKTIRLETGKAAKLAGGAVVVSCGETVVLVTACVGEEKHGDFLPLSCDYVEKTYAAGRIPGGFFKREGRLSEGEILTCRLMDRPHRPLFPEGCTHEIQVIATVLSADGENSADVLAVLGASAALSISEAPFQGPLAGVRVGRVDGQLIINPTILEQEKSDLNFIVAGTRDAIVMVEGGAEQVPEREILDALFFAHEQMQPLIAAQVEMAEQVGKAKVEVTPKEVPDGLSAKVEEFATSRLKEAVRIPAKLERKEALSKLKEDVVANIVAEDDPDAEQTTGHVKALYGDLQYNVVRSMILDEEVRIDGRDYRTVRPIDIDVSYLPRVHGSSLFTRGETQGLVVATLGTGDDAQRMDLLTKPDVRRHFMLHYNFPPFCVGETRFLRGPGRREIGHGALAERAIIPVLPHFDDFSYTIRVVSEIFESNGSSSMATVCGTSLALMDAGVPISAPVAGIAMGLIKSGDKFAVLTDILGDEDHLGDMDFKVCGTDAGVTALQMDIKIKGLSREIMEGALEQAREARIHILSRMTDALPDVRTEVSKYAPKIIKVQVKPDKIRDIIGPGGKTIKSITESCDVKIDIDDNGTVSIAGVSLEAAQNALKVIETLTQEPEVGKVYNGVVKRIADFGAFVEIFPGTEGLLHISQLAEERVRTVTDVVREGDAVPVKVLEVDRQGKIRLSRKEALEEMVA